MASRQAPPITRAKARNRELEGFLSLEETGKSENGLGIPNNGRENHKEKPKENAKLKKRKQNEGCEDGGSDKEAEGEGKENTVMAVEEVEKKDAKKKKRTKNKKKKLKKPKETVDTVADDTEDNDNEVEDLVDDEYYAWSELRLHPQLMKSIYRLRFKEPTPIQEACIPGAAHHKWDLVGAASTGSGKTLAFGLPILHRLLEERDNIDHLVEVNGDADEKIASKGLLRALVVSQTRELALQVTDHLNEVAKGTNIRVIPVLGGMSTEKQENLLKSRPEIVVGTPDILLELMLDGDIHLTELQSLLFFVVDDADLMKVSGHVQEMQSITDLLIKASSTIVEQPLNMFSTIQRKTWQTFIFCATYCCTEDCFSNELEGGVLSLEEVNKSELLGIPNYGKEKPKENAKLNKRKHTEGWGDGGSDKDDEGEGKENVAIFVKEEEKDANKKKNMKTKLKKPEEIAVTVADDTEDKNDVEEENWVDEAEYYAWNELRLHPQLMKSIYRLGFKKPTPIQQACIPAAAHQGMDLDCSAATGTGKTLAFGLPILHRLLEERDKIDNLVEVNGDGDEKIASKGPLRALILSATREFALQVTDHLKEVAKGTNIRVISIVGGMSTEKQERLLKARPEIVVGTPDRLLELMLSGEIHLIELHSLSFFVVDGIGEMEFSGQIQEMESIIDPLSMPRGTIEEKSQNNQSCETVLSFRRKQRQTFKFYLTFTHTFVFMRGVLFCPTTAKALILSCAPKYSKEEEEDCWKRKKPPRWPQFQVIGGYGYGVCIGGPYRSPHMSQTPTSFMWADSESESALKKYQARLLTVQDNGGEQAEQVDENGILDQDDAKCIQIPMERISRSRGDRFRGIGEHGGELVSSSSLAPAGRDLTQNADIAGCLLERMSQVCERARVAEERARRAEEIALKAQQDNEELRRLILSLHNQPPKSPAS